MVWDEHDHRGEESATDSRTGSRSISWIGMRGDGAKPSRFCDASSGTVLDSRSATAFSGGQYFTWAVTGRVLIRVTLTGGPNALYSALFFDR